MYKRQGMAAGFGNKRSSLRFSKKSPHRWVVFFPKTCLLYTSDVYKRQAQTQAQDVNIGKSKQVMLKGDIMTPETLWAMGRVGSAADVYKRQHQERRGREHASPRAISVGCGV